MGIVNAPFNDTDFSRLLRFLVTILTNNIRARLISRLGKIYFPNREISLALILFVLQFTAN